MPCLFICNLCARAVSYQQELVKKKNCLQPPLHLIKLMPSCTVRCTCRIEYKKPQALILFAYIYIFFISTITLIMALVLSTLDKLTLASWNSLQCGEDDREYSNEQLFLISIQHLLLPRKLKFQRRLKEAFIIMS